MREEELRQLSIDKSFMGFCCEGEQTSSTEESGFLFKMVEIRE